jgi:hypothetical protein
MIAPIAQACISSERCLSNLDPVFGDVYGPIYEDKWQIFSGLWKYDKNSLWVGC